MGRSHFQRRAQSPDFISAASAASDQLRYGRLFGRLLIPVVFRGFFVGAVPVMKSSELAVQAALFFTAACRSAGVGSHHFLKSLVSYVW